MAEPARRAAVMDARGQRRTAAFLAPPHAGGQLLKEIALVDRLITLDARVHDLERDNADLRRNIQATTTKNYGAAAAFDVPWTRFPWPLAEDDTGQVALGRYDMRVDDAVVREGRRGAAFLQRFGLLDAAPDFYGAVLALNEGSAPPDPAPDVSVVIPVHGQLAYTLNALDSLLRHGTRYRYEIIVVDDCSPDASETFLAAVAGIRYWRQSRNDGFIASCNAGAAAARGRFIVMLNNDTRVVEGWLDELIDGFARWPAAGLVGAKIFFPDGSLQEAGGIVWRNAAAANYGRGDDPNRPQYCYARQVDYVSGCSIAVPTKLWHGLAGFDPYFAPAYCEDVDLAFRIRDAGLQVWLQPQARIVHYEGKTSGTDTGQGVKAWQVLNTRKLRLRWRETLNRHRPACEAPYFERERSVHKRLLVVDESAPTPDQDAGSLQTYFALQASLGLGYKTSFVPADNWLFQPGYTTALQRMGVECAYAPYDLGFEAYMQRYGWQFDAVLVYRPMVMERCIAAIRTYAPDAAVLFHVADLHFLRMERTAALQSDVDMVQAAALMKRRELGVIAQADCTITHSSHELEILTQVAPGAPVALWPLMHEVHGTQVSFGDRANICFLGGFRHPPNVDAVRYFVAEIFPLLRAAEPGIKFIVAGAFPPDEILGLQREDIVVTGMVENLRTIFDAARVFVCPLRVGAGVKGKIATALSYGIPIVSTPLGVEGTTLTTEQNILVADDAETFAAAVLRLYRDGALWRRLSKNGLETVRQTMSPKDMGEPALAAALERAFAYRLGLSA